MTLDVEELCAETRATLGRLFTGSKTGLLKLLCVCEARRRIFPWVKIKTALLFYYFLDFSGSILCLPLSDLGVICNVLIEKVLGNHLLHLFLPNLYFPLNLSLHPKFIFLFPMLLNLNSLFLVNNTADFPLVVRLDILGDIFIIINVFKSLFA